MKKIAVYLLFLLSIPSFASVDIHDLHEKLKSSHTTQYEYKISKRLLFSDVDNIEGTVCSAYTPLECKKYERRKGRGFKLNTEHTWPQSKGAKHFPAQGDLHHLYATSKESNSKRANFPFCKVYETEWSKQGSQLGVDSMYNDCFEPVDSHKGNVARAMFYFSARYLKSISKDQEALFRLWNKLDPVDAQELLRNERIELIQGNRNPFIDNKDLIERIEAFLFTSQH